MIIVAIGWLYVVVMIAAVSDTLLKAVVRVLFLGVPPIAIPLWTRGLRRPKRREDGQESTRGRQHLGTDQAGADPRAVDAFQPWLSARRSSE